MTKIAGLLLLAGAAFLPAALAAEQVEGVLMDQACASDGLKDGQKGAISHTRDCALMEPCVKSGYGIVTADGKYLKFDDTGNQKALALLKASKKADSLFMKVTGSVSGDHISVEAIELE